MLIRNVTVDGLRDLEHIELEGFDRVVTLTGPTPHTTAVADALDLFFAALDNTRITQVLRDLELLSEDEQPEIIGELLTEQVTWSDTHVARALAASELHRDFRIQVGLALDPPQFGELRALAASEPRLVTALSEGASLSVVVTGLFTSSFDGLSLHLSRFTIGGEEFTATGGNAPWLVRFAHGLSGRWFRHRRFPQLAQALMEAALSTDRHQAYLNWQAELEPSYGLVRVAHGPGDRPILLADDLPLRRFGQPALRRAELAASIHLTGGEILWLETEDQWVEGAVEGHASALEQVFRVHPKGAVAVTPTEPDSATIRPVRGLREAGD